MGKSNKLYINFFNITKIFYYLPFFVIYNLWYNSSCFLLKTNSSLNRIIYERYYEENNVLYINTTDEEDEVFNSYLKQKLICPAQKYYIGFPEDKFIDEYQNINHWCNLFMRDKRFIRIKNSENVLGHRYVNKNNFYYTFSEEELYNIKNNHED